MNGPNGFTVDGVPYVKIDYGNTFYVLTSSDYDKLRWGGLTIEKLAMMAKQDEEADMEEDGLKLGELKKVGWSRVIPCEYFGLSFYFVFEEVRHRRGDVLMYVHADLDGDSCEVVGWEQPFTGPEPRSKGLDFRWLWERPASVEDVERLLRETQM